MVSPKEMLSQENYFTSKYRQDEALEDEAKERGENAANLAGRLVAQILLRAAPASTEPHIRDSFSGPIHLLARYASEEVEVDGSTYSLIGNLYLSTTSPDEASLGSVCEGNVSVMKH